jgi:hypothetical protein
VCCGYTNWQAAREPRPQSGCVNICAGSVCYFDLHITLDIKLYLEDSRFDSNFQSRPQITFRVTRQENVAAGADAVANTRRMILIKGISNAMRDPIAGTIARRDASQSLAAVISKLGAFVKIADETAKVNITRYICSDLSIDDLTSQIHPYASLVWQIASSVYKVRHTCHVARRCIKKFSRSSRDNLTAIKPSLIF